MRDMTETERILWAALDEITNYRESAEEHAEDHGKPRPDFDYRDWDVIEDIADIAMRKFDDLREV